VCSVVKFAFVFLNFLNASAVKNGLEFSTGDPD
jgi:hypothetical protein